MSSTGVLNKEEIKNTRTLSCAFCIYAFVFAIAAHLPTYGSDPKHTKYIWLAYFIMICSTVISILLVQTKHKKVCLVVQSIIYELNLVYIALSIATTELIAYVPLQILIIFLWRYLIPNKKSDRITTAGTLYILNAVLPLYIVLHLVLSSFGVGSLVLHFVYRLACVLSIALCLFISIQSAVSDAKTGNDKNMRSAFYTSCLLTVWVPIIFNLSTRVMFRDNIGFSLLSFSDEILNAILAIVLFCLTCKNKHIQIQLAIVVVFIIFEFGRMSLLMRDVTIGNRNALIDLLCHILFVIICFVIALHVKGELSSRMLQRVLSVSAIAFVVILCIQLLLTGFHDDDYSRYPLFFACFCLNGRITTLRQPRNEG